MLLPTVEELPDSKAARRQRNKANLERDQRLLGDRSAVGSVLGHGGEGDGRNRHTVLPASPELDAFVAWYRGLQVAVANDDGYSKGEGSGGGKPCEVIFEVDKMLERTVRDGRVPGAYTE